MQQAARVADCTAFFYMGELVECDRTDVIFTKPEQLADRGLHHGAVRIGCERTDAHASTPNREYEGELRDLREQLLLMGAKVEDDHRRQHARADRARQRRSPSR